MAAPLVRPPERGFFAALLREAAEELLEAAEVFFAAAPFAEADEDFLAAAPLDRVVLFDRVAPLERVVLLERAEDFVPAERDVALAPPERDVVAALNAGAIALRNLSRSLSSVRLVFCASRRSALSARSTSR